MKNHISYSELCSFEKDRGQYFREWVLGIRIPPTEAMMFGSLIHKGFETQGFDFELEAKEQLFAENKIRIGKKILSYEFPLFYQPETEIIVDMPAGYRIKGILDKVDPRISFLEIKTSASFWTQQQVDENLQLTIYAYLFFRKYGNLPIEIILIDFNSSNGKEKKFTTKRDESDFEPMIERFDKAVSEIKSIGWWDLRK